VDEEREEQTAAGGGAPPGSPGPPGPRDTADQLRAAGVEQLPDGSLRLKGSGGPFWLGPLFLAVPALIGAAVGAFAWLSDEEHYLVAGIASGAVILLLLLYVFFRFCLPRWLLLTADEITITTVLFGFLRLSRRIPWTDVRSVGLPRPELLRLELTSGRKISVYTFHLFPPQAAMTFALMLERARVPERDVRRLVTSLGIELAAAAGDPRAEALAMSPISPGMRVLESSPGRLVVSVRATMHPLTLFLLFAPGWTFLLIIFEVLEEPYLAYAFLASLVLSALALVHLLISKETVECSPEDLAVSRSGLLGTRTRRLDGPPAELAEKKSELFFHEITKLRAKAESGGVVEFGGSLNDEARAWLLGRLADLAGLTGEEEEEAEEEAEEEEEEEAED